MKDPKPFKTVDEQIEILKSRGVHFSDEQDAAAFLLREGYYAVINGYKDAFLDKQASDLAGEDRYPDGMPFEYFKLLYIFDTCLRNAAMTALLEAETTLRTTVSYAFCYTHREPEGYLDPGNYCSISEFHDERNYTRGLIRLLSTLQSIHDNKNRKSYVEHYKTKHRCLPLWVASKCMTFGTLATFYEYQQGAAKTQACIALARALGETSVKMKHLTYAFRTLPGFRNICAHSERFYCAGVGKNGDKHFPELLRALSYVTLPGDLDNLAGFPLKFFSTIGSSEPELKAKVLEDMRTTEEELQGFVTKQL